MLPGIKKEDYRRSRPADSLETSRADSAPPSSLDSASLGFGSLRPKNTSSKAAGFVHSQKDNLRLLITASRMSGIALSKSHAAQILRNFAAAQMNPASLISFFEKITPTPNRHAGSFVEILSASSPTQILSIIEALPAKPSAHLITNLGNVLAERSRDITPSSIKAENRDFFSRVLDVCKQCDGASQVLLNATRFEESAVVLAHSAEPAHDLGFVQTRDFKDMGFDEKTLLAVYKEGYRYVPALHVLFPRKSPPPHWNPIEISLARLAYPPALHHPQRRAVIRTILAADEALRPSLLDLLNICGKVYADAKGEVPKKFLTEVAQLRTEHALEERSIQGAIRRLETRSFTDTQQQDAGRAEIESASFEKETLPKSAVREQQSLKRRIQGIGTKFRNLNSEELDEARISESQEALQEYVVDQKRMNGHSLNKLQKCLFEKRDAFIAGHASYAEYRSEYLQIAPIILGRTCALDPNLTQRLALSLLTDGTQARGEFAEIKTGEGKSLMLALMGGFFAGMSRPTDILTSDSCLAARDADRFAPYFKAISVPSQFYEFQFGKETPPLAGVRYTTVPDLALLLLEQGLAGDDYRFVLPCDVGLVDEADDPLSDRLLDSMRLAQLADPQAPIDYETIWQFISEIPDDALTPSHFPQTLRALAERCREGRRNAEGEPFQPINDKALIRLFRAALEAKNLQRGEDYIVEGNTIALVDLQGTNRIKEGCLFDAGVHEFVCLKENLPLPPSRRVSGVVDYASFLKSYRQLCGISGTIGGELDTLELTMRYNIRGFKVPSHKKSRRVDRTSQTFVDTAAWKQAVLTEVASVHKESQGLRPILLICANINESREMFEMLSQSGYTLQIWNDTAQVGAAGKLNKENHITVLAGEKGVITVATGVAGRGVDIPSSPAVEAVGGLHVIITHLPPTTRLEHQYKGRTARQGRPGSTRIIACQERDRMFRTLPPKLEQQIRAFILQKSPEHKAVRTIMRFMRETHYAERLLVRERITRQEGILFQKQKELFATLRDLDDLSLGDSAPAVRDTKVQQWADYLTRLRNGILSQGINAELGSFRAPINSDLKTVLRKAQHRSTEMLRVIEGNLTCYDAQAIVSTLFRHCKDRLALQSRVIARYEHIERQILREHTRLPQAAREENIFTPLTFAVGMTDSATETGDAEPREHEARDSVPPAQSSQTDLWISADLMAAGWMNTSGDIEQE